MTTFDLIALLLTLTAAFGWINHRYIRLPHTIGLLVMGLFASLLLIGIELAITRTQIYAEVVAAIRQIDFYEAVMNGMLAFLLFAGALHVDFGVLRSRARVVGLMATVGVALSAAIVGTAVWLIAGWFGLDLPFVWALVFGALISPTDPVAVLSTLKAVKVPAALETDMTGESLFNDGVGVVLFTILVALAVGTGGEIGTLTVTKLLLIEAVGGGVLGLVTGFLAYRAMRAIDNYSIEILISLALVAGTYALATKLHTSGPIAVVVAGLLIGNHGALNAMSEQTREHLFSFWTLLDEILNSLLFLLIGLEVLILRFDLSLGGFALAAIPIALLARLAAVATPVTLLRLFGKRFTRGTTMVLTWGGLRGGISVALALSLPENEVKPVILAATYAVVLFSIIVQGLTLATVVRRSVTDERI
ncbi:MAG: sodium:proton antiporter [Alphaproteobacteria bacterium]|nr:sodium:proton antiporter [Alphaproteobacteria bacterium]MCW5742617.1 sodium:proton antiporter [Alphaproteobacteria bacterium]